MRITEEHLLKLIDQAINDTKAKSNGNKFHQGKCHGYVKALEQVKFAMTVPENDGGTDHLEKGIDA